MPGPLIPYRDAHLTSRLHVSLHEHARLALLEVIAPGRVAMGECDLYTRLDLRLQIDVAGRPVLIERALLDPIARPRAFAADREAFRCSGMLILVGYPLPRNLNSGDDSVWIGGDAGPDVAIVRGVSRAAEPLRDALLSVLARITP